MLKKAKNIWVIIHLKPLSFHTAVVPASGAEPGVSSNQIVQIKINVREKITNEISTSKVNCRDGWSDRLCCRLLHILCRAFVFYSALFCSAHSLIQ